MANISKRPIPEKVLQGLYEQLSEQVANAKTRKQARTLVFELLTKTERIMLAKRLAIVLLLEREWTFERIEGLLKVSPTTIAQIQTRRQRGQYVSFRKSKKLEQLLDTLEAVLGAGLSPRGKNRWRSLRE